MNTNTLYWLLAAIMCVASVETIAQQNSTASIRQENIVAGQGYIENKGQIVDQNNQPNAAVRYLLNRADLNVQLRTTGFSYDSYVEESSALAAHSISPVDEGEQNPPTRIRHYHRVDVEFVGANPLPTIYTEGKSEDYLNYFTTGTGEQGATHVHSYSKVVYASIYSGIDVEFFLTKAGAMEYQFVVHPGANPAQIRMRYQGAFNTQLRDDNIELSLNHGILSESIPKSYVAESGNDVSVRFVSYGNNEYGFAPRYYSAHQTLVIDPSPTLNWGSYYGGGGNNTDQGYGIVPESGGNLFVTGRTGSPSGIATNGAYQSTLYGASDVFILKMKNDGTRQWATYYGGSSDDLGYGVAVDAGGNIYITGWTLSADRISTTGAFQVNHGGATYDAFIAKFSSGGGRIWATYYGGSGNDQGRSIALDAAGNVFVTGATNSINAIASSGSHQTAFGGGIDDAFMVKFNPNGGRVWGSYYGGSGIDYCWGITIDPSSNVLITGATTSQTAIATSSAHQPLFGGTGNSDAFIAKFSNNGVRMWATYYGGTESDVGSAITTDANGNIFAVGWTVSQSAIATAGAYQSTFAGVTDTYLAKFAVNGERLWGTYYGGEYDDHNFGGVAVDADGNVYITGGTESKGGIASEASYQTLLAGSQDAFLAKFSTFGVRQWGTYYGGSALEYGWGIAVEKNDKGVLITGITSSTSGIATPGAHQTTCAGSWDAFIARFGECIPPTPVITTNSQPIVCAGESTQYTLSSTIGNIYQWQPLTKGSIIGGTTNGTITVVWKQAGTDTIRVRETIRTTGCFKDTFYVVTVNPSPIVSAGEDKAICAGQSVLLIGSVKGGSGSMNYLWSPATGLNSATVSAPEARPTATTQYVLSVTDAKGCTSRDTVVVQVSEKPLANAGTNVTICPNKGVPIGSPALNGYSYSWTPTSGLSDPTAAQPIANPTNTTTYQLVVVSNASRCTDTSRVTVTVTKPATTQSVSKLDFGLLGACESYRELHVELVNTESDDLTFDRKDISNPNFIIVDNIPFTLTKGVVKNIALRYAPMSIGTAQGKLTLFSNLCDYEIHVDLEGKKEEAGYSTDRTSLAFGTSYACNTVQWDSIITIKNAGSDKITIREAIISAPYTVQSPSFPQDIEAGATLPVRVRYTPAQPGTYSAELKLPVQSQNCRDTMRIPLSATHVVVNAVQAPTTVVFPTMTDCDTPRDTIITIHNTNSVELLVDGISSNDSRFTLLTQAPLRIAPGADQQIRVRFTPDTVGSMTSVIKILSQPCGSEQSITVQGLRQSVQLSSPQTLNFGVIDKGTVSVDTLTIVNTGSADIAVSSLNGIAPPFSLVKTTPPLGSILKPGDTLFAEIAFTAIAGTFELPLRIVSTQPCPLEIKTLLSAQGAGNDTVSTLIAIRDMEGQAGTAKNLVLYIARQANMNIAGAPNWFRARLRYNKTMLYNEQTSNVCDTEENTDCIIELSGSRTENDSELVSVPCVLTLGNSDYSELRLEEFVWTDGTVPLRTQTQNGTLRITGVCESGGVRLFQSAKVAQSLTSRPIPAQNTLYIQYGLRESQTLTLELINAAGSVVQVIENNVQRKAGQYTLTSTVQQLANGVYYLRLTTDKGVLTSKVLIEH